MTTTAPSPHILEAAQLFLLASPRLSGSQAQHLSMDAARLAVYSLDRAPGDVYAAWLAAQIRGLPLPAQSTILSAAHSRRRLLLAELMKRGVRLPLYRSSEEAAAALVVLQWLDETQEQEAPTR